MKQIGIHSSYTFFSLLRTALYCFLPDATASFHILPFSTPYPIVIRFGIGHGSDMERICIGQLR